MINKIDLWTNYAAVALTALVSIASSTCDAQVLFRCQSEEGYIVMADNVPDQNGQNGIIQMPAQPGEPLESGGVVGSYAVATKTSLGMIPFTGEGASYVDKTTRGKVFLLASPGTNNRASGYSLDAILLDGQRLHLENLDCTQFVK